MKREVSYFLMWLPQQIFREAEFMHQLKRGRMNRIPAKISKKIRVLFKNENIDPGKALAKLEEFATASQQFAST